MLGVVSLLVALQVASALAQNTGNSSWHTDQVTDQPGYTSAVVEAPLNVSFVGSWQEARAKAAKLVAQMTLEEKANVTGGLTQNARCEGMTGTAKRIGVGELCFQDGPLGIRPTDGNTVFPAGISVAATWDKNLFYERGVALGEEFKGKGINIWLGPVTGGPLGRTAYMGRNWEGFGPDPYLHGVASYQTVAGAQSAGVIATAKHYIAYEQETFRSLNSAADPHTLKTVNNSRTYSTNVNDRTMHELYLWPFAEAIRAGVGSIMISYNRINGTPAAQHANALNGILKTELAYPGVVISDWYSVYDGLSSALNGLDVEMPNSDFLGPQLAEAVNNGSLPLARLEDMAIRLFTSWYKMGQDEGYPAPNYHGNVLDTYLDGVLVNEHINVKSDHYKIARKVATDSITLLKHDGDTLPLKNNTKKLGIFGSDAARRTGLNNCNEWFPGTNLCPADSTFNGSLGIGWGSGASRFPYFLDPLTSIESRIAENGGWLSYSAQDWDYAEINSTAALSDICLVFTQANSGEDSDRMNLTLWDEGDRLVNMVANQCNQTVVIMHTVGPNVIDWADHPNVTDIINAHLPGQESGPAIAAILFGDSNPSGKMPYSWPKDASVHPPIVEEPADDTAIPFDEELLIDYRYLDAKNITPQFEFGFGLSYTTFEISDVSVTPTSGSYSPANVTATGSQLAPGGIANLFEYILRVTATVKNTGKVSGAEVAQVYVSYPQGSGEPPKQLRGFEKVFLEVGDGKSVSIDVRRKDVSVWDVVKQMWVIPEGEFGIHVGRSSRLIDASKAATFQSGAWRV